MTIRNAIENIDALIYNTYSTTDKIRWLSALDGRIKRNLIDTHEGGEDVYFYGYADETFLDTPLLVPHPYDSVYHYWLEAQIHYYDGENNKYNTAMIMYNDALEEYETYYHRTHRPKYNGKRFLF